jgi:hypothetical protein
MPARLKLGALLILALIILLASLPVIHLDQRAHADHAESPAVRRCLDNKGAYQIWRSKQDPNRFYLLCQIDEEPHEGQWSVRIIVKTAKGWFEKSAYIPKDGTWARVIKYLEGFATRWRQPLP